MRKTILGILIVLLVATPCLAQEIERDEMFSIEGTRWVNCYIGFQILCLGLFCLPYVYRDCDEMAFYEGDVYKCHDEYCHIDSNFSYIDTPLVSICSHIGTSSLGGYYEFAILQPSGFGVYTGFGLEAGNPKGPTAGLIYMIGIMFKGDNDWSPYDQPITCLRTYPCPEGMVCVDGYCVDE